MGMPAAKQGDKVTAVDMHITLVPPFQTPLTLPYVYSGTLDTALSANVKIEGKAAATVDSIATNSPPHVPIGGPFQKLPSNKGTVIRGSTSVFINGKAAARTGDSVKTCNDPADLPVGQIIASGSVFIGG